MNKKLKITRRVTRGPLGAAEAKRQRQLRRKIQEEFPPAASRRFPKDGLAARIRSAREAQGLTWYSVAKVAGIPNPSTVRDMELGRDTLVSNLEAVAKVLGLKIELIDVR
jgi:hypothetical protein